MPRYIINVKHQEQLCWCGAIQMLNLLLLLTLQVNNNVTTAVSADPVAVTSEVGVLLGSVFRDKSARRHQHRPMGSAVASLICAV